VTRDTVTVAVPVRNGGELFERTLAAITAQRVDAELEILVADSGSTDGSADRAREHGARVIDVAPDQFSHGGTRNLLLSAARGSHVALLTQDAEPADASWLALMLNAFLLGTDVALVYGPYIPRPDASLMVRCELERWFASLPPGVERLEGPERELASQALVGRRGFFTDANACIARAAWERVPFRDIAYAEDRALALDMLSAGFAKVYEPRAGVLHSHDYSVGDRFRRAFDEARGLREVYGWSPPASPRYALSQLRGELGALRREGAGPMVLLAAARHSTARLAGELLGSRASHLPPSLQRAISLERRSSQLR
jgi:glycosyltransferase involved in cell wall biosynthesis